MMPVLFFIFMFTHTIDFDIYEDYNPNILTFLDKSEYMEKPIKPELEVTVPGFARSTTMSIIPNQPNFFSSKLLSRLCDAECSYLPDGIYTIIYSVEPRASFNLKKYWLRSTLLEYRSWDVLMSDNLSDADKRKIEEFDILLKTAKAYAFKDNLKLSHKYYKEAEKIINKLNKCC